MMAAWPMVQPSCKSVILVRYLEGSVYNNAHSAVDVIFTLRCCRS